LQVALSVVLLVAAGLFLRSFAKLATLDIGFDRHNVLLVSANLKTANLPPGDVFFRGDGAFDVLAVTGMVLDGRVHAHITFADSVKSFGGHLERGTNVFTFAIVTMGVLNDNADLKRVDDRTYR
jgi:hypothetical protein